MPAWWRSCPAMIYARARTVISRLFAVPLRASAAASKPRNRAIVARRTASRSARRSGSDPGLLVEPRERLCVAAGEPQRAIAEHALAVAQVPHDFLDAPLARGVAVQRSGLGQGGEQRLRVAPLLFEDREQVADRDLRDVGAVKRRVLGGLGTRDEGGAHAARRGRFGPARLAAAGRAPRARAMRARASGMRRISFSRWSR